MAVLLFCGGGPNVASSCNGYLILHIGMLLMTLKNDKNGFTLIELMVVIAIAGVLSAIAIPGYFSWLSNARLKASTRDIYANIQKTKMEAIKRNKNVVMSFAVATPSCGTLPLSSLPAVVGNYTLFVDDGSGGGGLAKDGVQNGTEQTLVNGVMSPGVALCRAAFGSTSIVSFKPEGLPMNPGSLDISTIQRSQTITVTNAGAVRLQ